MKHWFFNGFFSTLLFLLFEVDIFFFSLLTQIFFCWEISIQIFILSKFKIFITLALSIFKVVKYLLLLSIWVRLLSSILFLKFYFYLVRSRKFLFTLDWLNSIFFKNIFLSHDDLFHISDHSFLNLKINLKFDILKFKNMIFNDDF